MGGIGEIELVKEGEDFIQGGGVSFKSGGIEDLVVSGIWKFGKWGDC